MSGMLEHLSAFCGTDQRYGLRTPFTCMAKGEPITVATNGHLMVVVDGEHGYPMEGTEKDGIRIGANAVPVLMGVNVEAPVTIDLAAVRGFLGMLPVPCAECRDTGEVECDECDGDGEDSCTCDECGNDHFSTCKACRGRGEVACTTCRPNGRVTRVRICGRLFDRENISLAFRHLPGETVDFQRGEPLGASVLRGSWGRMLVMPMRDGEGFEAVPSFDPASQVGAA